MLLPKSLGKRLVLSLEAPEEEEDDSSESSCSMFSDETDADETDPLPLEDLGLLLAVVFLFLDEEVEVLVAVTVDGCKEDAFFIEDEGEVDEEFPEEEASSPSSPDATMIVKFP